MVCSYMNELLVSLGHPNIKSIKTFVPLYVDLYPLLPLTSHTSVIGQKLKRKKKKARVLCI